MLRHPTALVLALTACAAGAREGDLDPRFSNDGAYALGFDKSVAKLDRALRTLVDKQGRYVTVGYVDYARVGLVRLLANGNVDTGYAAGAGAVDHPLPANPTLTDATMDSVGRVIVVGYAMNPLANDPFVCRYNADGTTDNAIGTNGCRFIPINYTTNGDDRAYAVTTVGSGGGNTQVNDVLIAGSVQRNDPGDYDFAVIRLGSTTLQPLASFGGGDGIQSIPFDVSPTHSGGDDDEAFAIAVDGVNAYVGGYAYVGGFAQSNDFAIAKISVSDGSAVTDFCPDAASCSGSLIYQGKRTFSFGSDDQSSTFDERIGAIAVNYGLLTVAGDALYGSKSDVVVARLTPLGSLFIDSQLAPIHHRIHVFDETRLGGLASSGVAGDYIAGTAAAAPTDTNNPLRAFFATKLDFGYLQPDSGFATVGGGSDALAAFLFPRRDDAQPIDHARGTLAFDKGRILLTGSRLWQRDTGNGINDFDFAVLRMQGDSIFTDGHEF